jgi:hypothetical protein
MVAVVQQVGVDRQKFSQLVRRIHWGFSRAGLLQIVNIEHCSDVSLAKKRVSAYIDRHSLSPEELFQRLYYPTTEQDRVLIQQVGRIIERLSVVGL